MSLFEKYRLVHQLMAVRCTYIQVRGKCPENIEVWIYLTFAGYSFSESGIQECLGVLMLKAGLWLHAQRHPCKQFVPEKERTVTPSKKWDIAPRGKSRLNRIPCCMRAPTPNQKLFSKVKLFSTTSESGLQGCGLYHS